MGFHLVNAFYHLERPAPTEGGKSGRSDALTHAVLIYLAFRADDKTLICWPSQGNIAAATHMSRPSVNMALNALCEQGVLKWTEGGVNNKNRTKHGEYLANEYTLVLPEGVREEYERTTGRKVATKEEDGGHANNVNTTVPTVFTRPSKQCLHDQVNSVNTIIHNPNSHFPNSHSATASVYIGQIERKEEKSDEDRAWLASHDDNYNFQLAKYATDMITSKGVAYNVKQLAEALYPTVEEIGGARLRECVSDFLDKCGPNVRNPLGLFVKLLGETVQKKRAADASNERFEKGFKGLEKSIEEIEKKVAVARRAQQETIEEKPAELPPQMPSDAPDEPIVDKWAISEKNMEDPVFCAVYACGIKSRLHPDYNKAFSSFSRLMFPYKDKQIDEQKAVAFCRQFMADCEGGKYDDERNKVDLLVRLLKTAHIKID